MHYSKRREDYSWKPETLGTYAGIIDGGICLIPARQGPD